MHSHFSVAVIAFTQTEPPFPHDAPSPSALVSWGFLPAQASSPGVSPPPCFPKPVCSIQWQRALCPICGKRRGGWMLATETADDSERMTGLWRRAGVGCEERIEWGEGRARKCLWRGLDEGRELRWDEDVKSREWVHFQPHFGMLRVALWTAGKAKRIRERGRGKRGRWQEHLSWQVQLLEDG